MSLQTTGLLIPRYKRGIELYLPAYARSHFNLKEYAEAKSLYSRLLVEDLNNYTANELMAFMAFNITKNYPAAIQYYRKCIELKPQESSVIYSNLGAAYAMNKDVNKAIESYENALQYGASPQVIKNLLTLSKMAGDKGREAKYQSMINHPK